MEERNLTLENRMEDLRKELYQAKELRDKLSLEAQKCAEERNRIRGSLKELLSQIDDLEEELKIIGERVNALRLSLKEKKEKRQGKKAQFQNLNNRLRDLKANGLYMSAYELEERIGKIEWRIQTTPLPLEEERRLVEDVKYLESHLAIHRQARKLSDEIESLKGDMDSDYREILELGERRKKLREQVLNMSKKAAEYRSEADTMHQKCLAQRDETRKVHTQYVEILGQVRILQKDLSRIEEDKRAKRAVELQNDLERSATEKLKARKRLSFDEFKVLAEKGKI